MRQHPRVQENSATCGESSRGIERPDWKRADLRAIVPLASQAATGPPLASACGERQAIMFTTSTTSTSITSFRRTVPVFFVTTEGHTRTIAEQVASTLREQGFDSEARLLSRETRVDWLGVRAVVIGASIHAGRHQKAAVDFARHEAAHLNARPSAFFSVSLSAGSRNPAEVDAARGLAQASSGPLAGRRSASDVLRASSPTASTAFSSVRRCASLRGARARRPIPAATTSSPTGPPFGSSRWTLPRIRSVSSKSRTGPPFEPRVPIATGAGKFPRPAAAFSPHLPPGTPDRDFRRKSRGTEPAFQSCGGIER